MARGQDRDIRLVLSLLDIRHAPSADDLTMLDFLIDSELPFAVVLTKTDKLTNNQLRARLEEIRTEIPCGDQVTLFPVSSMNGRGIEELRQTIESVVESESPLHIRISGETRCFACFLLQIRLTFAG